MDGNTGFNFPPNTNVNRPKIKTMEMYTNYEYLDDLENPEQYTESQCTSSTEEPPVNDKVPANPLSSLPFSRIKSIMKLDPELQLLSSESVFVMTKVTEMFIKSLARQSFVFVERCKKRTVQKTDVDSAIAEVDSLLFLEGALDFN